MPGKVRNIVTLGGPHMGVDAIPHCFEGIACDIVNTIAKKFVYADDLAIMLSAREWQALEGTLTQDMATLDSYLQKCKLKLSTAKTVTAAFHLHNRRGTT